MRVWLAQMNPIVGDLRGNLALIRTAARDAAEAGAELMVASELAVCGYPPKDLLLREGFVHACERAVAVLASQLPPDLGVLVGYPRYSETSGRVMNSASLLAGGRIVQTIEKTLLPNYDVFDERRYFGSADSVAPITFRDWKLGVHICEDAWYGVEDTFYHSDPECWSDPVEHLARDGVDAFVNLSASPFELNKPLRRLKIMCRHVEKHRKPFVFVNQVGGNDDLVFDGHSFVLDGACRVVTRMAPFTAESRLVDLANLPAPIDVVEDRREGLLLDALTLGLRDYMAKCGFTDCVLGLSGGIDSALAACIAARAIPADRVHALLMPSRYSTEHSLADAQQLAEALGIDWSIVPIDAVHRAYEQTDTVGEDFASSRAGVADQNLQARIRGAMVMLRSNRWGWIALATGNKSELAMGYCTLYGDMAGGFAVLADILKQDVYAVSRYLNEAVYQREVIPQNILTKPPSAELAPDQFDQDSLPPYDILDGILAGLIEREESLETVSEQYPRETVEWVIKQLDRNEFKRRQMPPGIKLSARAFGSGRRMPLAARINYGAVE